MVAVLAKDNEPAVLSIMTLDRLRRLAIKLDIQGLQHLNKPVVFDAIHTWMTGVKDCLVCDGGACNPLTHVFPADPLDPNLQGHRVPANLSIRPRGESVHANVISAVGGTQSDEEVPNSSNARDAAGNVVAPLSPPILQNLVSSGAESLELIEAGANARAQRLRDRERTDANFRTQQQRVLDQSNRLRIAQEQEAADARRQQENGARSPLDDRRRDPRSAGRSNLFSPRRHRPYERPSDRRGYFADEVESPTHNRDRRDHRYDHYPPHYPSYYPPMHVAPPSDTAAILKSMMEMQAKQGEQFLQAVKDMTKPASTTTIPIAPFGQQSSSNTSTSTQGRIRLEPLPNPANALLLGVQAAPVSAIVGDTTNMDLTKLKNKMVSGERASGAGCILKEERWPHKCLSDEMCFDQPDDFKDATYLHFASGMVNKVLLETPSDRIDTEMGNMLHFFAGISNLHHTRPWNNLKPVISSFFRSIERGHQTWSNSEAILAVISRAKYNSLSAPPSRQPLRQPDITGGVPPKDKKSYNDPIEGIPRPFLRQNDLCILFNLGICNQTSSHTVKQGASKVIHGCAGCFKLGRGHAADHGATKCPSRPFGKHFP